MQKADSPLRKWWYLTISLVVLLVVTTDQLTKLWIRTYTEGQVIFKLGFFQFNPIRNTGASFGLFQGYSSALTVVAIVSIVLLLSGAFLIHRHFPYLVTTPNMIALGLVIGGTVGNLIDRLRFGYVTDFLDVGFWPVFNVADSAVTVAVILIAISLLLSTRTAG